MNKNNIGAVMAGPFAPPRTAHTEDDEFDGPSLNSKWTKTNSAAVESFDDVIRSAYYCQFAASGSDIAIKQTYAAAATFSVTVAFSIKMKTNFDNVQIRVTDSTEANYVEVQALMNSVVTLRTTKNVAGSFSQVDGSVDGANVSFLTTSTLFFHIQRASNNWNIWVSTDGVAWWPFATTISLTFTVDHVVIQFGPGGNATTPTQVALHWFRRDWISL